MPKREKKIHIKYHTYALCGVGKHRVKQGLNPILFAKSDDEATCLNCKRASKR